jgi:hypothetical protein
MDITPTMSCFRTLLNVPNSQKMDEERNQLNKEDEFILGLSGYLAIKNRYVCLEELFNCFIN